MDQLIDRQEYEKLSDAAWKVVRMLNETAEDRNQLREAAEEALSLLYSIYALTADLTPPHNREGMIQDMAIKGQVWLETALHAHKKRIDDVTYIEDQQS